MRGEGESGRAEDLPVADVAGTGDAPKTGGAALVLVEPLLPLPPFVPAVVVVVIAPGFDAPVLSLLSRPGRSWGTSAPAGV